MSKILNSYTFLTIGKTAESVEASEGFKKYIGVGSSYVLAVNPSKEELEKIYGTEQQKEPEYVVDTENGKEVRIHFIVKTDPETNNGIEIISRAMFTLRNEAVYNRDKTKVQVIDNYGNFTYADVNDVEAGKKLLSAEGKELKIDSKYRKACSGEADLVTFLKTYLCVEDVFKYANGSWVMKDNPEQYTFALEHIKDYFSGNFQELKDALALQPNNKIKLLYGVRHSEDGNQYQAVAARGNLIMRNSAGSLAYDKVAKELTEAKARGSYPTTDFKVQELQEWSVEPSNLENSPVSDDSEMPWD